MSRDKTQGKIGQPMRGTRRKFLKNAATAVFLFPTLVPASAIGRGNSTAPGNRVTIGIIGAGTRGTTLAHALLDYPDAQITAVCDVHAGRANQLAETIARKTRARPLHPWRDYRDMFANAGLDAVVLATPDHWHAPMAIAAAHAALDVYGESPFAHTLAGGRAIVEAVRRHGCVWQSGSQLRSDARIRRAVELVRNGRLGNMTHVEVGAGSVRPDLPAPTRLEWRGKPPPELNYEAWVGPGAWTDYHPDVVNNGFWRHVSAYGGGTLAELVAHGVNVAQWGMDTDFTGPATVIGSGIFASAPPFDVELRFRFTCFYENGMTLTVSSDFPQGVRFYGERGWLHASLLSARHKNPQGELVTTSDSAILNAVPTPEEIHVRHSDDHLGNFLDCVKNRRDTVCPAETAHRVASIGHLGHMAILTGRAMQWDPATETIRDDPAAATLLNPRHFH